MKPLVSIILPTHNRADFLSRSVGSVLNQTFGDFELIIVDDASTDSSKEIIATFDDQRIVCLKHERNLGGAVARNTGIKAARGDFIAFQDSDDEWLPEKLEKQIKILVDAPPNVGVVYTGFWRIRGDSKEYIPNPAIRVNEGDIHLELLKRNFVTTQAVLVKKECFEKVGMFDEVLPRFQDWELFLRIAKFYEFRYLPEPLVRAYYTEGSISSNLKAQIEATQIILEKHLEEFKAYPKIYAIHLLNLCNLYRLQYDIRKSREYLIESFKISYQPSLILAILASSFGIGFFNFCCNLKNKFKKDNNIKCDLPAFQTNKILAQEVSLLKVKTDRADNKWRVSITMNSIRWKVAAPLRWLFKKKLQIQTKLPNGAATNEVRTLHTPIERRFRVVHLIANFMLGGSSRLVADLFEHLGHLYQQEVVTSFNPAPPAYTGIPIHEMSGGFVHEGVLEYFDKYQPDLIHIHYWGGVDKRWYEQVVSASEKYGCKVIENINTPVAPLVSEAIAKYIYVSDYVLQTFGLKSEKEITIFPGSNFDLFYRPEGQAIPDDCVGMVYRLERDKLNEQSIDPFIKVAKRRPGTKILIVGGGSYLVKYKRAARRAGVSSSFNFTDYVPYSDLPGFYKQMSLFVAPVWKESFGQVSPFAMSMGIPVVGYNVGALSEIIGTEEFLAPPGDSDNLADIIIGLLEDHEKRLIVGMKNRGRAETLFSVESMIKSYANVYNELLEERK